MMSQPATINRARSHFRSLYRALLRELPARPLTSSSPLRHRIRTSFTQGLPTHPPGSPSPSYPSSSSTRSPPAIPPALSTKSIRQRQQEIEQLIHYLRAQRTYTTLLERYNPGMSFDEEEKIRLTARRVGMEMPREWYEKK